MREERRTLGYGESEIPAYVIEAHKSEINKMKASELISCSDAVIIGSADEEWINVRKENSDLIFRYSERLFKKKKNIFEFVRDGVGHRIKNPVNKPAYLLCAGAFVSSDYAKYGLFRNKAYKWGYFPETRYYNNIKDVINNKNKRSILWAGRLIDYKHPENALEAALILKNKGIDFELSIIGSGEKEELLKKMIYDNKLEDCVKLLGPMKPGDVRAHMEKSEIFLFTSDREEGWGAVLNEAMNSGCCVVASHEIGSVPYLIKDGVNGMIYRSGDVEMLCEKIINLLGNPSKTAQTGLNAYKTISEVWNSSVAAERLVNLINHIASGEETDELYDDGPCSRAEIIDEKWF